MTLSWATKVLLPGLQMFGEVLAAHGIECEGEHEEGMLIWREYRRHYHITVWGNDDFSELIIRGPESTSLHLELEENGWSAWDEVDGHDPEQPLDQEWSRLVKALDEMDFSGEGGPATAREAANMIAAFFAKLPAEAPAEAATTPTP